MSRSDAAMESFPSRDLSFYRQIARLHMEGINQGFLPQLGLGFMTLLYEAIDRSPDAVLLVEQQGDRVLGFVSGAASMKPIYKQLLRKNIHLIAVLTPSLVRPARLKRIFEILRYSRSGHHQDVPALPTFELLSIVVSPEARGTGCADKLYKKLIQYCEARDIEAFKIIVGDALVPAHKFYQRMGAIAAARIEVHKGEGSVVYVHTITRRK